MGTDSAYAPVTSHLADVLEEPVKASPAGWWRVGFYFEPPMEELVLETDRAATLQAFEQMGYGHQARIIYLEPDEDHDNEEAV